MRNAIFAADRAQALLVYYQYNLTDCLAMILTLLGFLDCQTSGHLQVKMPLYHLRSALSRLWIDFPSSPHFAWQNSG